MKRLVRLLIVVFAVALVAVAGGSVYMLNYALYPAHNRGRDIATSYERLYNNYPYLESWVDSLRDVGALHDLYLTSDNWLLDRQQALIDNGMVATDNENLLHALYIPAARPTKNIAIVIHGYTDNAVLMLMIGHIYSHALDYNVLLPDLYGHGESYGNDIRMGWLDRVDVLRWADCVQEMLGGGTHMVVHGISMGAATTMMLAGDVDTDRPYFKCFVEDCGYTSVWEEFAHELRGIFHLPTFPLMPATSLLCRLRLGWEFSEASALRQVAHSTLPMLFIHGDADDFVPTAMVYPLYEAKPDPKEIWVVPGVAHAQAFKTFPEEYTKRVCAFVSRYIPCQEEGEAVTLTGSEPAISSLQP